MKYIDEFNDPDLAKRLLDDIHATVTQPWALMEVCGGQTHSIIRHGIDQLIPEQIEMIHGPGCPVCVTPLELIDKALEIASRPDVIFCSFGDMLRVPGSGRDLFRVKSEGGDVRVVYSPLDALKLARENPDKEVVFFGGYNRIDLLSESAGTRTAIIYSWRYPDSIHRSIMIGVNPPGHFLWDPRTTDEQIDRYAALCAKADSCRARTDDLAASLRQANQEIPNRWFFLPVKKGNVRIASFFGLMESTAAATPYAGPTIIDMWLSAAEGDPSGLWAGSFIADVFFSKLFVWGQYAAFGRADAQAARDYFSSG